MPKKTNSLANALWDSTQPDPFPRRQQGKTVQRDGSTRLVGAHFPEPVHRQLRVLAAQEGRTMYCVLAEALNDLFAKRKPPPIALGRPQPAGRTLDCGNLTRWNGRASSPRLATRLRASHASGATAIRDRQRLQGRTLVLVSAGLHAGTSNLELCSTMGCVTDQRVPRTSHQKDRFGTDAAPAQTPPLGDHAGVSGMGNKTSSVESLAGENLALC